MSKVPMNRAARRAAFKSPFSNGNRSKPLSDEGRKHAANAAHGRYKIEMFIARGLLINAPIVKQKGIVSSIRRVIAGA